MIALVPVVLLGTLYRQLWLRRVQETLRTILLREGRCVSCLHSLEGLSVESDGCVVCPECGAAWRDAIPDPRPSA